VRRIRSAQPYERGRYAGGTIRPQMTSQRAKARRFTNAQDCDHRRKPGRLVAGVKAMQDRRVARMIITASLARRAGRELQDGGRRRPTLSTVAAQAAAASAPLMTKWP
jgi:hypothetical protein